MEMTIDDKTVEIFAEDKNIVDVADRNKIQIEATCYRDPEAKDCCQSCVVEINGNKRYACSTKPSEGMKITIQRDDLVQVRKERIKEYREALKNEPAGYESSGCGGCCSGSNSECC